MKIMLHIVAEMHGFSEIFWSFSDKPLAFTKNLKNIA